MFHCVLYTRSKYQGAFAWKHVRAQSEAQRPGKNTFFCYQVEA